MLVWADVVFSEGSVGGMRCCCCCCCCCDTHIVGGLARGGSWNQTLKTDEPAVVSGSTGVVPKRRRIHRVHDNIFFQFVILEYILAHTDTHESTVAPRNDLRSVTAMPLLLLARRAEVRGGQATTGGVRAVIQYGEHAKTCCCSFQLRVGFHHPCLAMASNASTLHAITCPPKPRMHLRSIPVNPGSAPSIPAIACTPRNTPVPATSRTKGGEREANKRAGKATGLKSLLVGFEVDPPWLLLFYLLQLRQACEQ